ncbi:MAG: Fe-S cluster assembly ATPase SufC [Ferrimicrobium sp.]
MIPALEVCDLTVAVGGRTVLDGVSLSVEPGEVVAIMGPNGAGKSTLASAIMGRPDYIVRSGTIEVNGVSIGESAPDVRSRAGVALIAQYPPEVSGLSVIRLLELARSVRNLPTDTVAEELRKEAEAIALDTRLLDRWVNVDLSGGEKKKLESLIVGLVPASVVIGDEVDSGLDIDALRQVARRLRFLNEEHGLALLLITHYPRLLDEVPPGRVLVLSQGRIVAEGDRSLAHQLETDGYAAFV